MPKFEFEFESTSGIKKLQNPVAVVDRHVMWRAERDVQDGKTMSDI
jgi:hypothetical protein